MEMFSRCVGRCNTCINNFFMCIAGHGDDDYSPITDEKIKKILDNPDVPVTIKNEIRIWKKKNGKE